MPATHEPLAPAPFQATATPRPHAAPSLAEFARLRHAQLAAARAGQIYESAQFAAQARAIGARFDNLVFSARLHLAAS